MISRNKVSFASFLLCISICLGLEKLQTYPPLQMCFPDPTYDVNTTSGRAYRTNLETLLDSLVSRAYEPSGFFSDNIAGSDQETVHGLFLCRGDVNSSDCKSCLDDATSEVLRACPNQKRVVVWYEKCMVRFLDQAILHRLGNYSLNNGAKYGFFPDEVSDVPLLNKVLNQTLEKIVTIAANSAVPGKKFAYTIANYTPFDEIGAFGECTPDLTSQDCDSCLRMAKADFPICCRGSTGFIIAYPSCNIRYITLQRPLSPPTANPDHARNQEKVGISKKKIIGPAIIVPASVAVVVFVVVLLCIARKAQNKIQTAGVSHISNNGDQALRYSLRQVQTFTNNFSVKNRIGQGGFGPVYKGTLPDGQTIAVKRLSGNSSQGEGEFINEIALVAKLQHRNLVRLIGYCLEGDEKILMYEFVINKSLDNFLFDPEKQPLLDWSTRYKIIKGIARGLLYLHEDSRIKIIHRDLKSGNILLDQNMNAKIADFGMARLFEIGQSEGNTSKIAGTFGYMAPEYVFQGMLSVKSDVFSFGVLVLEIISGKRISNIQYFGNDDLLTYAWKQWMNRTPISVMDPTIGESYDVNEVTCCIYIGLLCVVEEMERRPTMASIIQMLNSPFVPESTPDQPALFGRTRIGSVHTEIPSATDSDKSSLLLGSSQTDVSFTEVYPR